MTTSHDALVAGLVAVSGGHDLDARDQFLKAAANGSLLAQALGDLVDATTVASPYDQAAAFQVFINGGDNVPLYDHVSRALADLYDAQTRSVLDIGAGDGRALIPAIRMAGRGIARLDVIEPSAELREALKGGIEQAGLSTSSTFSLSDLKAQDFFKPPGPGHAWDLVQSTFALQSLPPDERHAVFLALRGRTKRLAIVEFDVPEHEAGSAEEIASIAGRFELGLKGYGRDAPLVAGGFLAPILLGKVRDPGRRHNWEQPASGWRAEFERAGFRVVHQRALYPYSWSDAFLMVAEPCDAPAA